MVPGSRPIGVVLIALALIGTLTGRVRADDNRPNSRIDVEHYVFRVGLSDDDDRLDGHADIRFRIRGQAVSELALNLVGPAGNGTGMAVSSVSSDGQEIPFEHSDDILRIPLPEAATEARGATFSITYSGIAEDGFVISETKHGERSFFADNWPDRARHWIPAVDHPADKATVEFVVTAPSRYQVVGSGALIEETDLGNGKRRTHWRSRAPMATKVMAIGVAEFAVQQVAVVDGVPLQSWVYPQDRDAGFHDYAVAEKVLRFFAGHIGPYPYAKLANVQSKTRWGGLENASNIFYNEKSGQGTRESEALVAHEIAHQWFGDSVTEADWHHVWLSEGFASYFTQLYLEYAYGRDRLDEGMARARTRVLEYERERPDVAIVDPGIQAPGEILSPLTYQKGAWVLHMLRALVGDEVFWRATRDYYERFRDGNALTEQFQRVVERHSGLELEGFFEQWIYRPGHPVIEGVWEYDADLDRLSIDLKQVQAGPEFELPLEVGLVAHTGSAQTRELKLDGRAGRFVFDLDEQPADVILDPSGVVLMEVEMERAVVD